MESEEGGNCIPRVLILCMRHLPGTDVALSKALPFFSFAVGYQLNSNVALVARGRGGMIAHLYSCCLAGKICARMNWNSCPMDFCCAAHPGKDKNVQNGVLYI